MNRLRYEVTDDDYVHVVYVIAPDRSSWFCLVDHPTPHWMRSGTLWIEHHHNSRPLSLLELSLLGITLPHEGVSR